MIVKLDFKPVSEFDFNKHWEKRCFVLSSAGFIFLATPAKVGDEWMWADLLFDKYGPLTNITHFAFEPNSVKLAKKLNAV